MRRRKFGFALLLGVLVASPLDVRADEEPRIGAESISRTQVENLVTLGKVWGFLKYHHPRITNGGVEWDAELIRVLPSVLSAPDKPTGNRRIAAWSARLGPVPRCAWDAEALAV